MEDSTRHSAIPSNDIPLPQVERDGWFKIGDVPPQKALLMVYDPEKDHPYIYCYEQHLEALIKECPRATHWRIQAFAPKF